MIKNYFKVALRNLIRSKGYSAINIGGLAVGMSVAMLIGLWVWDEISFDKYHKNYNHIAQAWQFVSFGPEKSSYNSVPVPLAEELRGKYAEVFSYSPGAQKVEGVEAAKRKTILVVVEVRRRRTELDRDRRDGRSRIID